MEGKWNKKKQKKFEKQMKELNGGKDIDELFDGEKEKSLIPYTDINGKEIKIHRFGGKGKKAGAPDLEGDFEKKLSKYFSDNADATFYQYYFKEDGSKDHDPELDKRVFMYEEKKTTSRITKYGYMKPAVREKSVNDLMYPMFKVDPNDKYVNDTPTDENAVKEWEAYKEAKKNGTTLPELSKTVKDWITNKVAVSDLSEETVEVLFNGELPTAAAGEGEGNEYITGEGKFICPLKGSYYCNAYGQFGAKRSYESHPGLDMSISPSGAKIYASGAGTVTLAGSNGGYGNCCIIDHGNNLVTLYGHMLNGSPVVKKGQRVKKGQLIGYMGSTGWSTGPHLHFEVRKNGKVMDPSNLVKGLKHANGLNKP